MNPKRQRLQTVLGLAVLTTILPLTLHSSAQDYRLCVPDPSWCYRPVDCDLDDGWSYNDTYRSTPKQYYWCDSSPYPALCYEVYGSESCGQQRDCITAEVLEYLAPCGPQDFCITVVDP